MPILGAREEGIEMLLRLLTMTSPAIGLWCAYGLASIFVQPLENNAQLPRTVDPPEPFTVIVRTVPITAPNSDVRGALEAADPVQRCLILSHTMLSTAIRSAAPGAAATFT